MSETGWTPGPWRAETSTPEEGYDHWRVTHGQGGYLFEVASIPLLSESPEGCANATLIAAAPELYEALERLVDDTSAGRLGGVSLAHGIKAARAALKKARGEQ